MNSTDKYINSIQRFQRISKDREKELSLIIQGETTLEEKEKAKKELIESNLFLVISRAYKIYEKYFKIHPVADLIAEGNVALIKAADRFDVSREGASSFGTFAIKVIDQQIFDFMRKDRMIKIPTRHFSLNSKIKKLEEGEDDLTDKEIMKELNISKDLLNVLKDVSHERVISFEEIVDENGESSWEDIVEDTSCKDPYKQASSESLKNLLSQYMINRLTDRERLVIDLMFYRGERPTLAQLSSSVGVSLERVRQILVKSLRKLRKCLESEWERKLKTTEESKTENGFEPEINMFISMSDRYRRYKIENLSYEEIKKRELEYSKNIGKKKKSWTLKKDQEDFKKSRRIIEYLCYS